MEENYHLTEESRIEFKKSLDLEKEQMCKMYMQGRNDNHLDYYPAKHAKETYDEFFLRVIGCPSFGMINNLK